MMVAGLDFVLAATRARLLTPRPPADREVRGVVWDSRAVTPGCCFLGIVGERVDGNDFAVDAVSAGAALLLLTREPSSSTLAVAGEFDCPVAVVDDATAALTLLASAYRDTLGAHVVGITGSSGKTTTKDLVASVLARRFATCATVGNHNNELGVPATVLAADPGTEALVVEMGMRGSGQIAHLCSFVKPHVGVVTNIGVSHMELLGSRENIMLAKSELLEALPDDGCAVLNADDPFTPGMIERFVLPRNLKVYRYGLGELADVRALDVVYDADGHPSFTVRFPSGAACDASLKLQGEHNVRNALAAAAVGYVLGMTPESIAAGLMDAGPQAMRLQVRHAPGGVTVLDDTYNASPDSMRAALRSMALMEGAARRIAVLGEMAELGEHAVEFHREVGAYAVAQGTDLLVTIGSGAEAVASGAIDAGLAPSDVACFAHKAESVSFLLGQLREGDVVLVKASRVAGLEDVVKEMLER